MSIHVPVSVRELGAQGWRLAAQGRVWRLGRDGLLREAGTTKERRVLGLDAAKAAVRAACRPLECGKLVCAWCREGMGDVPGLPPSQTSHGCCPYCASLVQEGGAAWVVRFLSGSKVTLHETFRFGGAGPTDAQAEAAARAWVAEALPRRGGRLLRVFRLP